MNPQMFREYDIRGVTGKDMTAADAALIGRGVGAFCAGTKPAVSLWGATAA